VFLDIKTKNIFGRVQLPFLGAEGRAHAYGTVAALGNKAKQQITAVFSV